MAINKPTTSGNYYINSVAAIAAPSTALSTAGAVESVVADGVLMAGHRVTRPGVFTAGTPNEGSQTNYSSNS